jgi:hypothetical protein
MESAMNSLRFIKNRQVSLLGSSSQLFFLATPKRLKNCCERIFPFTHVAGLA